MSHWKAQCGETRMLRLGRGRRKRAGQRSTSLAASSTLRGLGSSNAPWLPGTFSWFGQSRRLAKEYEHLCETSEAMMFATMTRLMLKRLAPA